MPFFFSPPLPFRAAAVAAAAASRSWTQRPIEKAPLTSAPQAKKASTELRRRERVLGGGGGGGGGCGGCGAAAEGSQRKRAGRQRRGRQEFAVDDGAEKVCFSIGLPRSRLAVNFHSCWFVSCLQALCFLPSVDLRLRRARARSADEARE